MVRYILIALFACNVAYSQPSIVTSGGGRSIVTSGATSTPSLQPIPDTYELDALKLENEFLKSSLAAALEPKAVVKVPITKPIVLKAQPSTYVVAFTASWCSPCRTWKASELPKLRASGIDVTVVDVDQQPQWGVRSLPSFWIVDRKTRRALRKFTGYTQSSALVQYTQPSTPPSEQMSAPRYRIFDGVHGSSHHNRQSLINHLASDGIHAGTHDRSLLNAMTDQQLDDLHTADHRANGQVKHISGPVTQPQRRSRLPVVNTQWGRIDLETYQRNCNCPMCRGIRALQSQYRTMSLPAPKPVSPEQEPTPDDMITRSIDLMRLTSNDVLCDLGCGDARVLIAAVQSSGCNGIGVELDPIMADKARSLVDQAGLSGSISIVTMDALDFQPAEHGVTAVFVYLFQDILEKLAPKFTQAGIRVVASPFHQIPGLPMTEHDSVWVYRRTFNEESVQLPRVHGILLAGTAHRWLRREGSCRNAA